MLLRMHVTRERVSIIHEFTLERVAYDSEPVETDCRLRLPAYRENTQ